MQKKLFVVILLLSFFSLISTTYAKERYYINKNKVIFTKEEYDFLTLMYWDGCQELMTEDDYNKFITSNVINGKIEVNINYPIMLTGSYIESGNKKLKIVKSCSANCLISVTVTWEVEPDIKSYDVIGARLVNTNLINTPSTSITSNDGTFYSYDLQKFDNGFGASIKLPSTGSSIIINQTYRVSTGGHVYASYQHATSTISLVDSKKYKISAAGFGEVFSFSGKSEDVYDQMSGVEISV